MESISVEQFLGKPRKELISEREALRTSLRGEIAKFCRNNFENMEPEDLAKLYDVLLNIAVNGFSLMRNLSESSDGSSLVCSKVRRFIPQFAFRRGDCRQNSQNIT
jgi:hypothetical protein